MDEMEDQLPAVDRRLLIAAGVDERIGRAGLHAQAAVHAAPDVDLVGNEHELLVGAAHRLEGDAVHGADLYAHGAGGALRDVVVEEAAEPIVGLAAHFGVLLSDLLARVDTVPGGDPHPLRGGDYGLEDVVDVFLQSHPCLF